MSTKQRDNSLPCCLPIAFKSLLLILMMQQNGYHLKMLMKRQSSSLAYLKKDCLRSSQVLSKKTQQELHLCPHLRERVDCGYQSCFVVFKLKRQTKPTRSKSVASPGKGSAFPSLTTHTKHVHQAIEKKTTEVKA